MLVWKAVSTFAVLCWMVLPPAGLAQQKQEEKPKYGGRVIFGALKDIVTTNPFRNTISFDYAVRSLAFEGLTGLDRVGNVVPCLSKSWSVSKDGLTHTFLLRGGVKFHNGKGFTAEDVRWSLDYLRDPKNRAYFLDQYTDVKSIEAPEPLTVVFILKKPYSPLTAVVATTMSPIVPAGSQFSVNSFPPGTGPFQFVEWQAGHHLTLRAFKDYWIPGIPYLDEIVFKPIVEDNVRLMALKAKDIDMADELPPQAVADAGKTKEFNIINYEAGVRRRIVFNTRFSPFNDVRIRQAVAFAIDKAELAAGQTWGFARPTNQRYPSFSRWHIDLRDREQDLQKARSLLAAAGYREGIKVKVPVYPGPDMELTTVLKDQLKKVGIELEFDVMDWAAHTKVRNSKQFTLYSAGMGSRADPDQVYYPDTHSNSSQNGSGYANPEVDQLLEKGRQILDFKERKRLYTEVLKFIQRDVPEIYLYMGPKFYGVRPHVKGFSTGAFEDRAAHMGGGLPYTWTDQ